MDQQLINIPLWDKARWKAVGFGYDPSRIPFVALVFTDGDAGIKIFNEWREVLGEVDDHDALRIAFIEGAIPGEEPGYTVHIGMNPEGMIQAAKTAGKDPTDPFLLVSRIHRMPTPDSAHLAGFKREFVRQGRYLLTAARLSSTGELLLARDANIAKTYAIFKQVADIGPHDVDSAIFAREASGPQH
jgi:hypothetical protein